MSYFVYVYSPSDFVVAPPDEVGAMAAGTPTFTLTLKVGATPTLVEINDDESVFDEVDGSQTLNGAVNLDGTAYGSGTSVHTAYDLINTTTGHKVTSIHFGGTGYEQGAVDGIISTVEMVPGTAYTFNTERTSHTQDNQYSDYTACFASGTMIATDQGETAIQDLSVGDLVETLDNGMQPIRWCGSVRVAAIGNFAPIVFRKGAIGNAQELRVSPEHRILVRGLHSQLYFGQERVLVAAKSLVDGDQVYRCEGGMVTYHHFMFDQHEIVFSGGAETESFLPSQNAMHGLSQASQDEILRLFPELASYQAHWQAAARCLRAHEAVVLRA